MTLLIFKSTNKSSHSPSISITPLPGGRGQNSSSGKGQGHMQGMKPGQPGNNQGRGFVICEVCDGYIKDMDQLRNHMQWIHKVNLRGSVLVWGNPYKPPKDKMVFKTLLFYYR